MKAKVKTITKVTDYNGKNGLVYYHHLIMDNGDKINIGKKEKLKEGDDLNYELTGGSDDQFEYKKAQSIRDQQGYKPESKDQGIITYLSVFSSCCNFFAQRSAGPEAVFEMAEKAFNEAKKKSTL